MNANTQLSDLLFALLIATLFSGCGTFCNDDLRLGEQLRIPINLSNFRESEITLVQLEMLGDMDTTLNSLDSYLINYRDPSSINYLTDNSPQGYYSSDLDGKSLYFLYPNINGEWEVFDSITQIVIRKSQEKVSDPCYKDHPNIQIDEVSYIHNSQTRDEFYTIKLER